MNTELLKFIETKSDDDLYILVQWPWVQQLMEYEWFREECLLYCAMHDQNYLSSAYFVPVSRLFELKDEKLDF